MEQYIYGLDIGESHIKLVKASYTNGQIHLCFASKIETKGFKNSQIFSKSEFEDNLKELFDKVSTKENPIKEVVLVLPSNKLNVTRKIVEYENNNYPDITSMDDVKNLKKEIVVQGVSENYVAVGIYPLNYYSDGKDIGKLEPYGERVKKIGLDGIVNSLPVDCSRGIIDCLEDLGIEIKKTLISPLANASLCLNSKEVKDGAILLDIGSNGINISAFYNQYLILHNHIKYGVDYIIKNLCNDLSINEKDAKEYLVKYGVGNSSDAKNYYIPQTNLKETDVAISIESSIDTIANEIKKNINTFVNDNASLPIIITGGGANIYKLDAAISNTLNRNCITRGYNKIGGKDYSYNSAIGAILNYVRN